LEFKLDKNRQTSSFLQALKQEEVIVYPTEAVYGLGCDPDSENAVNKLLAIKQRPVEKGLILIADNYAQILNYVDDALIPQDRRTEIFSSWPGAMTWVMPAKKSTPKWLTGQFDTIAVRVTDHPVVKSLCREFGKPLVSTSANLTGQVPVMTLEQAKQSFGSQVAAYVEGQLGGNTKPSQIRDAFTGKLFRA
jgi:L-threonylcarbamoyladenylate synthase